MTTLTISRFLTATSTAKPDSQFTAPIHDDGTVGYDARDLIATYAEQQFEGGFSNYFSFSRWDGSHDMEGHQGTTALTLEYDLAHVDRVRDALATLPLAYYEIPTIAGRSKAVLFAFPVEEALDWTDTTRAASLIAQTIEQGGLFPNSFLYTYFFRFRDGGPITFRDGVLMSRAFIDEAHGIITRIKAFVR